jgi:hypothetical protein
MAGAGAAAGAQALDSTASVIRVKANLRNILFSPEKDRQTETTKTPCRMTGG